MTNRKVYEVFGWNCEDDFVSVGVFTSLVKAERCVEKVSKLKKGLLNDVRIGEIILNQYRFSSGA